MRARRSHLRHSSSLGTGCPYTQRPRWGTEDAPSYHGPATAPAAAFIASTVNTSTAAPQFAPRPKMLAATGQPAEDSRLRPPTPPPRPASAQWHRCAASWSCSIRPWPLPLAPRHARQSACRGNVGDAPPHQVADPMRPHATKSLTNHGASALMKAAALILGAHWSQYVEVGRALGLVKRPAASGPALLPIAASRAAPTGRTRAR